MKNNENEERDGSKGTRAAPGNDERGRAAEAHHERRRGEQWWCGSSGWKDGVAVAAGVRDAGRQTQDACVGGPAGFERSCRAESGGRRERAAGIARQDTAASKGRVGWRAEGESGDAGSAQAGARDAKPRRQTGEQDGGW